MGKKKPEFIRNVGQLIHWHYAKLIAEARCGSREEYALVMHGYKKLESGEISISGLIRDNKKFLELEKCCVYCRSTTNIQLDHIIPLSKGGPDTFDNLIYACRNCNISKGNKSLPEWYGDNYSNEIPAIVFSKFLKLIYQKHKENDTLKETDFNGDGILDYRDLTDVFC